MNESKLIQQSFTTEPACVIFILPSWLAWRVSKLYGAFILPLFYIKRLSNAWQTVRRSFTYRGGRNISDWWRQNVSSSSPSGTSWLAHFIFLSHSHTESLLRSHEYSLLSFPRLRDERWGSDSFPAWHFPSNTHRHRHNLSITSCIWGSAQNLIDACDEFGVF